MRPLALGVMIGGAALVAVGCANKTEVESGPGTDAAQADTVTGVVRRVGNEPFVRTLVQGDDTVFVAGDWEAEIARLAGAQVMIVGTYTTGDMPGAHMDVARYEIVSVDGDVPVVGRLESDDDGFYVSADDGEVTRLIALSPELAARKGAKVWIVSSDQGVVQRYGIIAAP
jgi:hypothetical protein